MNNIKLKYIHDYTKIGEEFVISQYEKLLAHKHDNPDVEIPQVLIEAYINLKTPAEQKLWRELEEFGVGVLKLDSANDGFYNIKFNTHIASHAGRLVKEEIWQTVINDLPEDYGQHKEKVEEVVSVIRDIQGRNKIVKCSVFCKNEKYDKVLVFEVDNRGMFGTAPQSLLLFKNIASKMLSESGLIQVRWEAKPNVLIKTKEGFLEYVPQKVLMGMMLQDNDWLPMDKGFLKQEYNETGKDIVFKELEYDGKIYRLE